MSAIKRMAVKASRTIETRRLPLLPVWKSPRYPSTLLHEWFDSGAWRDGREIPVCDQPRWVLRQELRMLLKNCGTARSKYNPEQFEIVGMSATAETMDTLVQLGNDFIKEYRRQGRTGHFSPNMYGVCYFHSRGKAKVPYGRILIKSRKEEI